MRIISCHIENFGKLSDFSVDFEENLTVFRQENGWGKSTLAAFLRVMFFGFEGEAKRKGLENERKRYAPWQGGVYGGQILFETGGKRYSLSRVFADKQQNDVFELRDAQTNLVSTDFSENLGEEIFRINSESFKRTVFIGQNDCATHATDSINAKIGNLADSQNDLDCYEKAATILTDELNRLNPRRKTGEIFRRREELTALETEVAEGETLSDAMEQCEALMAQEHVALEAKREEREHLAELAARISRIQDRKAKQTAYEQLLAECEEKKTAYQEARAAFPGAVPEEEALEDCIKACDEMEQASQMQKTFQTTEADLQFRKDWESAHADDLAAEQAIARKMAEEQGVSVRIAQLREAYESGNAGDKNSDTLETTPGVEQVRKQKSSPLLCVFGILFIVLGILIAVLGIGTSKVFIALGIIFLAAGLQVMTLYAVKSVLGRKTDAAAKPEVYTTESHKNVKKEQHAYETEVEKIEKGQNAHETSFKKLDEGQNVFEPELREKEEGQKAQEPEPYKRIENEPNAQATEFYKKIEEQKIRWNDLRREEQELREQSRRYQMLKDREKNLELWQQKYELERKFILNALAEMGILPADDESDVTDPNFAALSSQTESERFYGDGLKKKLRDFDDADLEMTHGDGLKRQLQKIWKCRILLAQAERDWQSAKAKRRKFMEQNHMEECGIVSSTGFESFMNSQTKNPDVSLQEDKTRAMAVSSENSSEEKVFEDGSKEHVDDEENGCGSTNVNEKTLMSGLDDAHGELPTMESLNQQMASLDEEISVIRNHLRTYERQLSDLQEKYDHWTETKERLETKRTNLADLKREYRLKQKAKQYLTQAKETLTARYMEPLMRSFSHYYQLILKQDAGRYHMDANANLTAEEQGLQRETAYLSTGYQDLLGLCMRLAFVEAMYQGEHPFLILDDPFVNLDDEKLVGARALLEDAASRYQVIYFTCSKVRC